MPDTVEGWGVAVFGVEGFAIPGMPDTVEGWGVAVFSLVHVGFAI